jgi:hypothetical protein
MRTESLKLRLRAFLPSFLTHYAVLAEQAAEGGAAERGDRRIARLLKDAKLPREKTLATVELARFPTAVRTQIGRPAQGEFLEGATTLCGPSGPEHCFRDTGRLRVRLHGCFLRLYRTPAPYLVKRSLSCIKTTAAHPHE